MAWGKAYLFQHKYKFRGFQLRTGVFCVLFLLTVRLREVRSIVELNHGVDCDPGGPQDQCINNLECIASITGLSCGCEDDYFYDPADNLCKPKLSHGSSCYAGGPADQCVNNLECISGSTSSTCSCGVNYYYDLASNTCEQMDSLKVSDITAATATTYSVTLTWKSNSHGLFVTYEIQAVPGGLKVSATQTGGIVTGLTPGTQYIFNVTSVLQLQADSYYPEKSVSVVSSPVWTKIGHAETCVPGIQPSDLCLEANTACISSPSGESRCLCTMNNYRSADDTQCNALNELMVSSIQAPQRLTNNVTLAWSATKHGTSVTYTIQPNGGVSPVSGITENTSPVTGLTPGTQYTFIIISVLPAAGYYLEKSVASTASSGFWTKPAKPGLVTSVQLVAEIPVVYNITFEASQGHVSLYSITVNSLTAQSTGSAVTVTSLQPGQSYSYTITAYNGNNDPSEPRTSTLTTPVIGPGPVTGLGVNNTTGNGAKVTWKYPDRPNSIITGYTLTVTEGSACVYGYIITCSDCSTPGVSGNIASCTKTDGQSTILADLNGNTRTFTVDVLDLEPYRNYTARVTADNIEGTGIPNTAPFRTLAATARDVLNVTPVSARNSVTGVVSLTVTWTPGYFTGPTNYVVALEEETSLGSNNFMKILEAIVTGYDNNEWTKTDVLAYWNYRVYVLAMTDVGNSSLVGPSNLRTATNTPGLPQTVTVQQDKIVAQELALTITCPREKERNGIITGYVIRKTLLDATGSVREVLEYTVDAFSSQPCTKASTYSAKDVDGIAVGHNYTFGVKVKNTDYTGSYSQQAFLYVVPRAPRFEEIVQDYGVSSLVRQQGGSTRHQTEIDVSVCASCLLDNRQGTVVKVGLVVCKVGKDDQCIDGVRKRRSLVSIEDYTTWSRARAQGFTVLYRATPDNWMSTLTAPNTSYPYKIGTDANCPTTVADTVYCNGPLPTDTRFRVAVIQCNSVGCVIGTFEGPFRTGDDYSENTTLPIVLGVVIPVVIIIAIIIIIVIVIKRRRSEQHKKEGDQRPYNTMNTAMNDAHLYHGVTGRTYVSPPHTNHDGQDNIAMAGLQTHQASLYQRDVTEYTEPDHYDYIGDNSRQNPENQASQSHDRVGQTGEGEQNRINPYNNLTAPVNAQGKKDYYNM